jgi:TrmH family RNA methyltransferase
MVIEGPKLLDAALGAGVWVETVFLSPEASGDASVGEVVGRAVAQGARVFDLASGVMERIAGTVSPQPLAAVVRSTVAAIDDLREASFVVVCVDVRDPGNAGAVIRVADAAGADGVVCCRGAVDPRNPKTVRASAGSVFHLPVVVSEEPLAALGRLGEFGMRRIAAVAHGGAPHTSAHLGGRVAVVFGNEASGLPDTLSGLMDEAVTIELPGRAESLNVSTAAAVLCFEVARRRSTL